MTMTMSILMAIMAVVVAGVVFYQVSKGKLLLRYSLLWLAGAILAVIGAIFPQPIFSLAKALGFIAPSNFILFVAVFLLFAICFSLCVIASRQQMRIKNLMQDVALLKNRISFGEHKTDSVDPSDDEESAGASK